MQLLIYVAMWPGSCVGLQVFTKSVSKHKHNLRNQRNTSHAKTNATIEYQKKNHDEHQSLKKQKK